MVVFTSDRQMKMACKQASASANGLAPVTCSPRAIARATNSKAHDWIAHASRVLTMASSPSPTFLNGHNPSALRHNEKLVAARHRNQPAAVGATQIWFEHALPLTAFTGQTTING